MTNRPSFTQAEAEHMAANLYGLTAVAHPLPSERDQNFLLTTPTQEQFVLKITGLSETAVILEMQNQAMTHVRHHWPAADTAPCPQVITAVSGQTITTISQNGASYPVRLITYLPGTLYADLPAQDAHLQRSYGRFLGQLNQTLATFAHPAAHRYLQWNLTQAAFISGYTQNIAQPDDRALVEKWLAHFTTAVAPQLPSLRHQIIHNDANDHNVLTNGRRVNAIIDFGDMVYAPTVCESAIGAAYALLGQPDPLLAAAQVVAGYHSANPLTDAEIALLFPLILMRLCVSVTVASTNQLAHPNDAYLQISAQPAWQALRQLDATAPDFASAIFRHTCQLPPPPTPNISPPTAKELLLQKRTHFLGPNLSLSYNQPLKIVRGSMQYLYDENGRAYLDAVNNVPHVGHCHPHVVQAGQRQMALLNTNTRYLHDGLIEYAERLAAYFPDPLRVVYFVCSGSEANELALRLARTYTHRHDMLVLDAAYHGNTGELVNLSPYKFNGRGGQGAPDYVHVLEMPDPYRGRFQGYGRQTGHQYAQTVAETIATMQRNGRPPAAFIEETLLGCGGQIVLPDGYLQEAYAHVRAAGGVCIADEVQIGFGRVGSHFWGFATQGVVPDIVTMGKPMGNGHPLAAVITTPEIAAAFHNGMEYFNTFGGNPVSCAIGMAVLDVIEQEKLQQNALEVGNYLMNGLRQLQEKHLLIGDVRGLGLYVGAELVRNRQTLEPAAAEASAIANAMKERGVLISTDGPLHNVLKIKPPIIFTKENADQLVQTLDAVLDEETPN